MRAAATPRPYIGLRYFEERDAQFFYGRDEHVSELLAKVAQNRFVAVMGSSGCGKSSLVRAGLLPELRSGMIPKAGPRWKIIEFRPGTAPINELAAAIRSSLGVEQAQHLVEEGPLGIARAVAQATLDEGTNILLIADQFEEVFRFQREESSHGRGIEAAEQCHALTRRLLDVATQTELPIYVLLVMRSDYLGECAQFPDLPERMSESLYLVPRPRRDQLQEAITAPVGGSMEPSVVQRLLSEVGSDPDQLPRLQHLLGRMWDRAQGGRLTMAHYAEAGGWDKGLEQHLEQIYESLKEPQQVICARLFQQLSELDRGRAVRRRAELAELVQVCGSEVADVIDKFRHEGFLVPQANPVDITHESILREWPRVREWLDRENRSARRLRELAEAANDAGWRTGLTAKEEEQVRPLAGLTLQNLTDWRDQTYPPAAWASRYLAVGEFEAAYGYLEWSEARDLDQKKRARQRTRIAFALLAILLVGLAGASLEFYALKQDAQANAESARRSEALARSAQDAAVDSNFQATQEKELAEAAAKTSAVEKKSAETSAAAAEQNARESKAREWAAFSIESLSTDPEKSILLAMQAVHATLRFGQPAVPAAEQALHQAILSSSVRKTFKGPKDFVSSVAWSPDGKRLATASGDGTVKVWDAARGLELLTLKDHVYRYEAWSVAWSPDGKRLAAGYGDGSVEVWDAGKGLELLILEGYPTAARSVAWSPDGKRLAKGSYDGTTQVLDTTSGRELFTLKGHSRSVNSVAWSPDGKYLATGSDDTTARLWDSTSGQELLTLKGLFGTVRSVAWSPDGKRLATGSDENTARVWDTTSGQELLALRGHTFAVTSVAWSPDGTRLATGSIDQTARLWDTTKGKELLTLCCHGSGVSSVAWSPDGESLATGSIDQTAKVWDATNEKELPTLKGHTSTVMTVAWSPDGNHIVTGGYDKTAKVWDASNGKELLALKGYAAGGLNGVAWSPDGKRLAVVMADKGREGTAQVWDAVRGKELFALQGPAEFTYGLAWSPNGAHIAVASEHSAAVWDAATGTKTRTLEGHLFTTIAWSPDSKRLAAGTDDNRVKIWDAARGLQLLILKWQPASVYSLAWSPDGKRLAGAGNGYVKVWDAAGGLEQLSLQVDSLPLQSNVSWSPDGKQLATQGKDNTATIWDAASGQELLTLRGHTDVVTSLAWSPDGKRLAVASEDRTVQIYAMDIRDLLALARTRVTRDFTPDECKRYSSPQSAQPGASPYDPLSCDRNSAWVGGCPSVRRFIRRGLRGAGRPDGREDRQTQQSLRPQMPRVTML